VLCATRFASRPYSNGCRRPNAAVGLRPVIAAGKTTSIKVDAVGGMRLRACNRLETGRLGASFLRSARSDHPGAR